MNKSPTGDARNPYLSALGRAMNIGDEYSWAQMHRNTATSPLEPFGFPKNDFVAKEREGRDLLQKAGEQGGFLEMIKSLLLNRQNQPVAPMEPMQTPLPQRAFPIHGPAQRIQRTNYQA